MGKKSRQIWKYFKVENGGLVRLKKECPRCGSGIYMAEHKDRWSCGKCGYTEWKKKPEYEEIPQAGIKIKVG
ncbi:MAG TPA: 30S ribosomal protein S27ae [Candidatus Nanopusillus sp.]|nr:30S ribosomal protein S27ae [Candidatus Nanopusillus sp.]HIP90451.1 30S ribosomal protein S27ae [Candidatus Nanopusillus sp.]